MHIKFRLHLGVQRCNFQVKEQISELKIQELLQAPDISLLTFSPDSCSSCRSSNAVKVGLFWFWSTMWNKNTAAIFILTLKSSQTCREHSGQVFDGCCGYFIYITVKRSVLRLRSQSMCWTSVLISNTLRVQVQIQKPNSACLHEHSIIPLCACGTNLSPEVSLSSESFHQRCFCCFI